MFPKIAGVVLILATIAAGIYVDLTFFLVNGIKEIVHGVEAHPNMDGGQIGWGIVHVMFAGVGGLVAFVLCVLWAILFFGWHRESRSTRSARPMSWMDSSGRTRF